MKKSALSLSVLITLIAITVQAASIEFRGAEDKSTNPRIAVLEFSTPFTGNDADKKSASLTAQSGFNTELVRSGKFRIVEREPLRAALSRENLPLSGDIDKETAVKIGKILGVNYLLTGAVTEYGLIDKGAHSHGPPTYGVTLKLTLINTSTGEVAWTGEERNIGPAIGRGPLMARVMKPCIQKLTATIKSADL